MKMPLRTGPGAGGKQGLRQLCWREATELALQLGRQQGDSAPGEQQPRDQKMQDFRGLCRLRLQPQPRSPSSADDGQPHAELQESNSANFVLGPTFSRTCDRRPTRAHALAGTPALQARQLRRQSQPESPANNAPRCPERSKSRDCGGQWPEPDLHRGWAEQARQWSHAPQRPLRDCALLSLARPLRSCALLSLARRLRASHT